MIENKSCQQFHVFRWSTFVLLSLLMMLAIWLEEMGQGLNGSVQLMIQQLQYNSFGFQLFATIIVRLFHIKVIVALERDSNRRP